MLKVLIVDDELLVRNNLRTLIEWEECGFTICGEATNGAIAINKIESLDPHIVIMDISMPVMDGVVLSQYIRQRYPNIKMIVLSSYDDYEYVRETLKNKALDYLLKHQIDAHMLIKVLKRAENEISEEHRKIEELEQTEKKWEIVSNVARQNYVKELVLGAHNNEEMQQYYNVSELQMGTKNIVVVVMQISNFILFTQEYSDKDKNSLVQSAINLCMQILNELDNGTIAYLEQGKFVFLFFFEKERSEAHIYQLIHNYMDRMSRLLNRYLDIQVIWGSSKPCGKYSDIPICYQRACKIIKGRSYIGENEKGDNSEKKEVAFLTIHHEKKILAAIEVLDIAEIHVIIDEIFDRLETHHASYLSVQMVVSELITIIAKVGRDYKIDMQTIYRHNDLKKESSKLNEDFKEIKAWVKGLYTKLVELSQKSHSVIKYSKYVNDAVNYMCDYYRNDITLNEVAEQVGITPSYLSRLFKEETGKSFITYLSMIRVEMARKFIGNGESNIKDLYQKVGFNSYNYFFKVFKEIVGCTPLSYVKSSHLKCRKNNQ